MDYGQYQMGLRQPVNGLVRVTGIEGARAYQLPPNSVMPLFDGNEDVFFLKTTDGGGFPTLRRFRFAEEPLTPQAEQAVTRQELNALSEKIDRLMEAMNGEQLVRNVPSA